MLLANIALNGLYEQVVAINAALSDTASDEAAWQPGKGGGWAKGRLAETAASTTVAIKAVTLDSLAESGSADPAATTLVWYGHAPEEGVFYASARFLERRIPFVFVRGRPNLSDALPAWLAERGYEHCVDLLRSAEGGKQWEPQIEPISAVSTLSSRNLLTDVLVY
jgi:hypothetical protein